MVAGRPGEGHGTNGSALVSTLRASASSAPLRLILIYPPFTAEAQRTQRFAEKNFRLDYHHKMAFKFISNWIDGAERGATSGELFDKLNPANGQVIYQAARSASVDIDAAVAAAKAAQPRWAALSPVLRGEILLNVAMALKERRDAVAERVATETGKSPKDALGETNGAISLGVFMAGEGQRLYGRTTTSATTNKYAMTIRQPVGIAGLIIAANTRSEAR